MKAVILAAGMGSRLARPHPKPLTPLVTGQTIMAQQVSNLVRYLRLADIYVVVGYKKELIMEDFPDLTYVYNSDYDTTNTSKSLLRGLSRFDSDDVVWLNGDVVFDHQVLSRVLECGHSAMAVVRGAVSDEEIKYRVGSEGWIVEISKTVRAAEGEAVGINKVAGGDLARLRQHLERCADGDYFEKAIETGIDDGLHFYPVDTSGLLATEVDFAEDLERANKGLAGREATRKR
jgi:choline kinase